MLGVVGHVSFHSVGYWFLLGGGISSKFARSTREGSQRRELAASYFEFRTVPCLRPRRKKYRNCCFSEYVKSDDGDLP